MWITTNSGKFLKWWEHQTTLPVSWETCIWIKKQQLEPYMEQLIGSKLGKDYAMILAFRVLNCKPVFYSPLHPDKEAL